MCVHPISCCQLGVQRPSCRDVAHPDELQLCVFWQVVHALHDTEDGHDNVDGRVSLVPEGMDCLEGRVDISLRALQDHVAEDDGVGLVADLEDVVVRNEAESTPRALEVVDGLSHVSLSREDERRKSLVVVLDSLRLANLLQALEHLGVAQLAVPQDRAAGLDRLDDLVAHVAREGKAGRVRVDLHRAAERLLRAGRHAVRLVEDDHLVPPRRERDLALREGLDLVPHHVDAALVRGVQLKHTLAVRVAQERMRETVDRRRLADTGKTLLSAIESRSGSSR